MVNQLLTVLFQADLAAFAAAEVLDLAGILCQLIGTGNHCQWIAMLVRILELLPQFLAVRVEFHADSGLAQLRCDLQVTLQLLRVETGQ